MEEIRVNDICIIDPDNVIKIAGTKCTYCRITRIESKLLSKLYFAVFCDEEGKVLNPNEFNVNRELIRKANPNEYVVTRFPYDVPIISSNDVTVLAKAFDTINGDPELQAKFSEIERNTLAKLVCKLNLFSSVVHEY